MNCIRTLNVIIFGFSLFQFGVATQKNTTLLQGSTSEARTIYYRRHSPFNLSQRMVTNCKTPNGENAFCMNLTKCTKLQNRTNTSSARQFFQESRCGPKNENKDNPRVCCGRYSDYIHPRNKIKSQNLFPKVCGRQNVTIHGRIFGGTEAQLGEFPWIVRLFHKDAANTKSFGCSGFLIAPTFILTAAHCIKSENVEILGPVYEVHLGEHNTKTKIDCNEKNTTCAEKLQVIRVLKNIPHPEYLQGSRNQYHDIGLIHLKKAAKFTKFVSPICLLEKVDFAPFEYWISGWGSTERSTQSNIKLKVSIPPFPQSNCTNKFDSIAVTVSNQQICAGGKRNEDSCKGDSGGPLMLVKNGYEWFAAGVVSFGFSCGKQGWPGIYTNVTSYRSWIEDTIRSRVTLKSRKTQPKKKKN